MKPIRNKLEVVARKRSSVRWAPLAGALLLALGLVGCASFKSYKIESRPLAHPIVIDGRDDDWRGNLYLNVQGMYSLGFVNDDQNLYVCLVVTDPYKRSQIIRGGLTLWLDAKGGQQRKFGIRFPVGTRPGDLAARGEGRPEDRRQVPPEDEYGQVIPAETWNEFGIISGNSQMPLMIKTEEGKGLEMKASAPVGMFVYELKIPLRNSEQTPWAVGAQPGQSISVGFETGKAPTYAMNRDRGGYGGGRGGYPGGGYGRSGMGGDYDRGGIGRGIQIPEELRVWASVKLR